MTFDKKNCFETQSPARNRGFLFTAERAENKIFFCLPIVTFVALKFEEPSYVLWN